MQDHFLLPSSHVQRKFLVRGKTSTAIHKIHYITLYAFQTPIHRWEQKKVVRSEVGRVGSGGGGGGGGGGALNHHFGFSQKEVVLLTPQTFKKELPAALDSISVEDLDNVAGSGSGAGWNRSLHPVTVVEGGLNGDSCFKFVQLFKY